MNKKFLSAILFGALMVTSTGTFVSCKDYDDDIENLQTQISANASAIAELKTLIQNGDYVTNVAVSGQNLVVTFKNAGSQTLALPECEFEDEVGSICTISDEGELLIDGKATGIKVAEPTEENEFKPAVEIVNGEWAVLQEDNTYKSTGVAVSSVAVTGDEKNGFVLTVKDAEGVATTIKLPTAASLITAIIPADNAPASIAVSNVVFDLNKTDNVVTKASDWKGTKALPANGDYVYASASTVEIRVNPLSVDATAVPFYLTNTKNVDIKPITMYAVAESGDYPMTNTQGRAANLGNGLYTLGVNTVVVKQADNDAINGTYGILKTTIDNNYVVAINANHSARSPYQFTVTSATAPSLTSVKLVQGSLESSAYTIGSTNTATQKTYKVGKAITVKATEAAALYDMYLAADASDVEVFGLTFDQAKHTVTIGKNPDVSSVQAYFTLYVTTVANDGTAKKTTIKVNLDPEMSASEYALITHDVDKAAWANYFGIDLATMKTALGNDLAAWTQNVDLSKTTYDLYSNKACTTDAGESGVFTYEIVKTLDHSGNVAATTNRNEANYIRVYVDNDNVDEKLKLNTTYYIKASFYNNASPAKVLSTIVVPVKFTAPALNTLFTQKAAYVKDGVINAYFYKDGETRGTTAEKTVDLPEYFSKYVADAQVDYDNTAKVGTTDKYTSQIATGATVWSSGAIVGNPVLFGNDATGATAIPPAAIGLNDAVTKAWPNNQFELGYNEVLTFKVSKDNFAEWLYTEAAEKVYTFKMRIMSSIIEGTIAPATGSSIEISASDATKGAKITADMIKGYDYNKNDYNVVPDMVLDGTDQWANTYVTLVEPLQDAEQLLLGNPEVKEVTLKDGKISELGYFVVKAKSISNTTTVQMPVRVTDAWGYKKTQDVPVKIKMN